MELSRRTWLITSLSPGGGEKMSKHSVPASDVSGLLRRFAELKRKAAARTGRTSRLSSSRRPVWTASGSTGCCSPKDREPRGRRRLDPDLAPASYMDSASAPFVGEAVDGLRRAEAGEGKFPKRHDPGAAISCERGRQHGRAPEFGGQPFQPGGQVHRRSDAGEVEAVDGTDIAVEQLANMQRQAVARRHRIS